MTAECRVRDHGHCPVGDCSCTCHNLTEYAQAAVETDCFEIRLRLKVGTSYDAAVAIAQSIEESYSEVSDEWGVFDAAAVSR